jgi:two-component system, OmpR family, sensor histidine kinase CreC
VSIRQRVLLGFILLTAGGVLALTRFVSHDLWPFTQQTVEESLIETAAVLAAVVEERSADRLDLDELRLAVGSAQRRRLQARIYSIAKDTVDLRVYVTDTRGIVLFDSDQGRDVGRDYSRWNDVRRTLEGSYGARATRTETQNPFSSVLYVAAPIRKEGRTAGVLSVGKPMQGLELIVWTMRQRVLWTGALLILLAAIASLALSLWITEPIGRLTAYARAIGLGERVSLPRLSTREIATLGEALESMRQALEGKRYVEGYVRSLTHEIKAPLSAIRAAAELLQEDMPAEDRRRFMTNIRTEADRLQALVDRMLELSALEALQRLERTEQVDLGAVAQDVVASVAPVGLRKEIQLASSVTPSTCLAGDRFLIRQALLNLVTNALRATPPGGSVRISAQVADDCIELVIEDTGPGIPDYALPRVFERFYTVPASGQAASGTGLGLPFVREVAHLHGGTVTLTNRPEGGARAVLRLPRAKST